MSNTREFETTFNDEEFLPIPPAGFVSPVPGTDDNGVPFEETPIKNAVEHEKESKPDHTVMISEEAENVESTSTLLTDGKQGSEDSVPETNDEQSVLMEEKTAENKYVALSDLSEEEYRELAEAKLRDELREFYKKCREEYEKTGKNPVFVLHNDTEHPDKQFEEYILDAVLAKSADDPEFTKCILKEGKTLESCINYIFQNICTYFSRKSKRPGGAITNDVVLYLGVEYWTSNETVVTLPTPGGNRKTAAGPVQNATKPSDIKTVKKTAKKDTKKTVKAEKIPDAENKVSGQLSLDEMLGGF